MAVRPLIAAVFLLAACSIVHLGGETPRST
jgi:hypothetical protein